MSRLLLAALAVLVAAPVSAQSELSTSPFALGVSGNYAGVVSTSGYGSLAELRAPGVSLDASYSRFTVGAGLSFYEYVTPVTLAAGFHLDRSPGDQRATTVGVSLSTGLFESSGGTVVTPSLAHQQRVYGRPGIALVPGAALGLAVGTVGRDYNAVTPVASAQLGVVLGRGETRAVVAPSVGWSGGGASAVSVGVSAGVTRGLGRR